MARLGLAWRGMARQDKARQGKVFDMPANDNDTTERYAIRYCHMPRMVHCWGPHKWRVFDNGHAVSVGFATYAEAESCVATLKYCDERWPARAV
jgi:hypothetical protein